MSSIFLQRRWLPWPSFRRAGLLFLLGLAAVQAQAWQMKQAALMTQWAALVDTNAPLPEYPRPQLVRTNWLNLNGIWQFQPGATNDAVPTGQTLTNQILVPYPMESAISGVMKYSAFSWYRRAFSVPTNWSGQRIILHLDAVDWQSTVYVNGQSLGVHKGGYDPFSYDITPYLNGGTNELIVQVYSPEDASGEPRGKQTLYPGGIMYTSSSGIWQPVWLEPVDASGVSGLQIIPDVDNARLRLTVNTLATNGVTVSATVLSNGVVVNGLTGNPQTELDVRIPNMNLWSPENPFLYDLKVSVIHNGVTNDTVTSYFGMRKIAINVVNGTPEMFLNNQAYFEMGPLDQGFWPDGLYTAPTDAAQAYDLQMTKALGFNMVRKHIKVERQRWYNWADKLGLLVWQDMPSGNSYTGSPQPINALQFITELSALVTNHWNSPCIIMWDTFNEGQGQTDTGQTNTPYLVSLVKSLDPYRLVNEASGGAYFNAGDVMDNHSYPAPGNPTSTTQAPADGEYGGIGFQMAGHLWNPALAGGNYVGANTTNDIATIYDSFADDLVYYKSSNGLNAAVYTQITDVENECNGLMTYDRILKPSLGLIYASNRKAITAQVYLSTVLPASQTQARNWSYTTNTPATNWYAFNYNAAAWSNGPAGFGTTMTPGAVVGTVWNSSNIWLRQTFTLGTLTPQDRSQLAFNVFHDEDCQIYLNGVLAGSASGYVTSYGLLTMNTAGQNALVANGTNVLAVHCVNTGGGQDIDVGISKQVFVVNALVVPTDYLGYWPLDETNGTVAYDLTGYGNNGAVTGAAWSANGKVNGCLNFNGTNNYVQIANTISNDFSISFWVKTTQTGGTGQWWQGRGLVDGFVAAGSNDFGTALTGGQFAFGTGNPDTTIRSTNVINDGAWHQCVATRQQSSGTLSVYVDGVLSATGTGGTNSLMLPANLRFGAIRTGVNFFNGSLDDIRVYNRALGNLEVQALYGNSAALTVAPTNLTATAGNNQVILSWANVPNVTGYDLKRATHSGGPYTNVASILATSYIDATATNGTTWYYVVAAANALGDGTNSAEVSATPSLAASLLTWFAADRITGLANGAAVSNWADLSGNGFNATQPAVAQLPTYVTNAVNHLPVVRFNSASSNYLAFPRPVQDDFTIFCVFRSTQGYGSGTLYYQGAGLVNGEVSGVTTDFGSCLFANGQICAGTGNPDVAALSGTGYNDGLPHLMTFKRTEATGEVDLYLDGTFVGSTTGSTSSLTAPNQLVLGALQTIINFFNGDIGEVKIFNSALSDTDRVNQESGLVQKWGIPVPPPPTGVTATAGNAAIQIKWNSYPTATNFKVKRATVSGGPYATLASPVATNFTDATVVNGTNYYYVVTMVTPLGESTNSAEVSAVPAAPVPVAWFKADAITGLANGAVVSSWSDVTSNGFAATQSTTGKQPAYLTNVINGLPVVRFNSTNGTFLSFNRPVQTNFTLMIVYRCSQTNQGTPTTFFGGAALVNGDQPNAQNDFGTCINGNGQVIAGTGNPDTSIISGGGFNDGNPHVVTFTRTKSTGALALYVDGTLSATGTGNTNALTAPTTLAMGIVPSGGGALNGDLAEVKIFASALPDLSRIAEENSLACKYNLSLGSVTLTAPAGLTGVPGSRQIVLNWSGVSGAASYLVSAATNAVGPFLPLASGVGTNSYTDASAVNGQTRYYEVTAVNGCNVSASSVAIAVYLPKPVLTLAPAGGSALTLNWPLWANGWSLYVATNLNPPVSWLPATNVAATNTGQYAVSLPVTVTPRFYRLSAP